MVSPMSPPILPPPNETLWRNVKALMEHHWGREHLSRLSREAGVGLATTSRIKACNTSVGIDVLASIARVFDLQPWHLLVPGLDVSNPPTMTLTQVEADLYRRLRAAYELMRQGQ